VLPRTWALLRDTTHILLQGVPRGIDLDEVRFAITAVDGVAGTHDLHFWSVAGDDRSLTVHVELAERADANVVRVAMSTMLVDRFAIEHATIQTEDTPCSDESELHA
jgi:cobalt-zinc-cadmium efflux system protein